MKILTRQDIGPIAWDAFCLAHPGAWFLWTSAYLDYQAARGTRELSFGIMEEAKQPKEIPLSNDQREICELARIRPGDPATDSRFSGVGRSPRLVAICPLFLEERDGVRSFTMEGHPGPWPLVVFEQDWDENENIRREIMRNIKFGIEIDGRQNILSLDRVAFRMSPFYQPYTDSTPLEMREEGFGDISWHTQIIDLTRSGADLHAGIRKSYTSLINKVTRTYELVVDDKGELLKAFKRLHFGQAGRQTRPDRTWEIQREWCEAGNGLIVAAMRWNIAVACTYWILYKGCACYASSASINPNVTHALIWKAMLEFKARGVQKLEMGWVDYPGDPPGLGKFKTGFGGEMVPVIAVERRFT